MRKKAIVIAAGLTLLVYGSVMVFLAFDRGSHSASDTLRPFILTMAPVWALTVAAARSVLRRSSS